MMQSIMITNNEYSDLNPILFGYQNCPKKHFFGPAIRTHWLIHYVVSGCGTFKIGAKTYHVKAGEMFVIPPYVETYYEADDMAPWNYIWIGFIANANVTEYLEDVISCPDAEKIFHQMKNCINYSVNRSAYLTARLWDLFALLSETRAEKQKDEDYIQKAMDCIHAEYMHNITINELAQRLSLDRTYFSVIFKKKMGISPKQYLLNYRMKTAASLIRKNNVNVSSIANSVGYSDLYVFSKMFKRHFGVSPTNYAKQYMEK